MTEQAMQIDDARTKLGEMEAEYERIPANAFDRADREHRVYLKMQIDTYRNAIQVFDEGGAV
jgi:hypothetical protein